MQGKGASSGFRERQIFRFSLGHPDDHTPPWLCPDRTISAGGRTGTLDRRLRPVCHALFLSHRHNTCGCDQPYHRGRTGSAVPTRNGDFPGQRKCPDAGASCSAPPPLPLDQRPVVGLIPVDTGPKQVRRESRKKHTSKEQVQRQAAACARKKHK